MRLRRRLFSFLILLLPTQLSRHFWPGWSYVFGLKIDYLSPTIYLTDLLVIAIFGSWLGEKLLVNYRAYLLSQKKQNNKKVISRFPISLKNFSWTFPVFVFLPLNCLLAENQGAAFYKLIKIFEFVFLGIYIIKEKIGIKDIHVPLTAAVFYSSLIALFQFFKQSSLGGLFWWLGERSFNLTTPGIARGLWQGKYFLRPYSTFSHPNSLAGFILVSSILTFPYLRRKNISFFLAYSIVCFFVLIVSFSRAVWFTGIIVISIIVCRQFRKRHFFSRKFFIPLFFILLLLFFGTINNLISSAVNFSLEESFLRRGELNEKALLLISKSPLTGIGLNNFIPAMANMKDNSFGRFYWLQPVHNIYLLIAAETGLTGFILFLGLSYLKIRKFLNRNCAAPLLFSLTAIFFLGFFDHYWITLQQNQLLLVIALSLSLVR